MLVAPISEAVTKGVSYCKQQILPPRTANSPGLWLPNLLLAALLFGWLIGGNAQQAPQFDDLAARAVAARDSGNVPQAIELYGQATRLKPDWAEGWFYQGLLQYSSNNFPGAIDALSHVLELKPGAAPALALRGLSEFETGAYDDSLRDLDEGVKKGAANEPRNEQIIRYHLAQMLARAGRFQDAMLQYQFFASNHIDDPDLLLGLGLAGMRNTTLPKDFPAEGREVVEAAGSAGYVFLSGDSQGADGLFKKLFER